MTKQIVIPTSVVAALLTAGGIPAVRSVWNAWTTREAQVATLEKRLDRLEWWLKYHGLDERPDDASP